MVLLIVGLLILVIIGFVVYRLQKVKHQNRKLNALRFERVKPLYEKLKDNGVLTAEEVVPFAVNPSTRKLTFLVLRDANKSDLFPPEYLTIVKGAESDLAGWLEFPTELDACPDEIEHIKRVTFDFDGKNNLVHYEVFKYRVDEPHWAAKDGWILGVVGPYFDDSRPYDHAGATFSRTQSTLDKVSPEEEAKWVHEHISMKR